MSGFAPSGVACSSGYTGTVSYQKCSGAGTPYTVSGCLATQQPTPPPTTPEPTTSEPTSQPTTAATTAGTSAATTAATQAPTQAATTAATTAGTSAATTAATQAPILLEKLSVVTRKIKNDPRTVARKSNRALLRADVSSVL